MPTIIATCSQSWPLTYFLAMRFNLCLNNYCYWQEITCNFPPKVHPLKNHIHISYFPQTVGWAKWHFGLVCCAILHHFPPQICVFLLVWDVLLPTVFSDAVFSRTDWFSGQVFSGSEVFKTNYLQSAPLPVTSRATTPLIGVVTPVAHSCRPYVLQLRLQLVYWPILFEKCANCER